MAKQIIIDDSIIRDNPVVVYAILIFIMLWVVLGFIAFVCSLWCFKYDATLVEKLIGLLLAIFTGPLYFIYYKFNTNYCRKNDITYMSPTPVINNTPNTPKPNTPKPNTPKPNTPKNNNVRFDTTNRLSNTPRVNVGGINKKSNNMMSNGILKNNGNGRPANGNVRPANGNVKLNNNHRGI
jgi:hypothetical protein